MQKWELFCEQMAWETYPQFHKIQRFLVKLWLVIKQLWAVAVTKFQEFAIRTIELGRKARRFYEARMPLVQRAVADAVIRINYFLRMKTGKDLTIVSLWAR